MTPSDPVQERLAHWQRWALMAGIAGILLAIAGYLLNGWTQFLRSYLYGYLFWTGMGLGCMGILLLYHTVGGNWGMMIRRMCEAGARTVPFMLLLLIPVLLSLPVLYPWARPDALNDPIIRAKSAYLNIPGVIGRSIFYFLVWTFYAWRLSKLSADQDRTGDPAIIGKLRALSAPGLVVFTFVTTFAFIDWIMSLEPHWFSTIYGAMFLIGQMLEAFAFTIALVLVLGAFEPLRTVLDNQRRHDLGNMMFAFMVLWAYLSFSQFLITWAGNLPDEIPWYLRRMRGGWGWVAFGIVLFHFGAPFVLLLFRGVKRKEGRLLAVCALLLGMRFVDVYWIVEPAFYNQQLSVHWLDFVMPVAVGGLWLAAFFWQLRRRPLLPLRDPRISNPARETVAY